MDRNRANEPRNRIIRHAPMPVDANQTSTSRSSAEKQCTKRLQTETESTDNDSNDKNTENDHTSNILECSVCLQHCIHPVQLPCRHIFCFLCVKGAAHRSKRCALCRQEISPDFFTKPTLLRREDLEKTIKFDDQYQWFYEGRNGWWQYDDRTSQEIELKHKNGEKMCELLIAGFLYIIDFENMVQFRRNDRTRKRNIKRDVITASGVKGVAGLKYASQQPTSSSDRLGGDGGEQQPPIINMVSPSDQVADDAMLSPPAPNNTPQTPQTPADSPPSSVSSSQQDLSAHFQHLGLGEYVQPQSAPVPGAGSSIRLQTLNQTSHQTPCDRASGSRTEETVSAGNNNQLVNQSQPTDDSLSQLRLMRQANGESNQLQPVMLASRESNQSQSRTVMGSSGTTSVDQSHLENNETSDSDSNQ